MIDHALLALRRGYRVGPLAVLAIVVVSLAVAAAGTAQTPPYRDPSPHQIRFVTVDGDVALEVLDWGGSGQPIVLLAGSGNSAHVFDEFAPKLTGLGHVYGITRRGHGSSSRPMSGYDDQRLADDLFEALERERIPSPVLIGHSASGGEMTTLARQHPARVSGLVYMDGLSDLEDDPPADKEWLALQQKLPPGLSPQPSCGPPDRSTFEAFRSSLACQMGFALPLSELRMMFQDVNGSVGSARVDGAISRAMGQGQVFRRDYSNIRGPVLALVNFAPSSEALLASTGYRPKDDAERAVIEHFVARSREIMDRSSRKLTSKVPNARVVYLGNVGHFVFITRQAEVLREIGGFLPLVESRVR